MKSIITLLMLLLFGVSFGQTEITESFPVSKESLLELDFAFADSITIKTWDRDEVKVMVDVTINDGKDDNVFRLETERQDDALIIKMDKDLWEKAAQEKDQCHWKTDIFFTIYMPESLELKANTISGNYVMQPHNGKVELKTISGDIDITVKGGIDFQAKTISGEIYSDLDITYPNGTDGLTQIVGMNVTGRVSGGGPSMNLETISGSIFLRKGIVSQR